MRKRRVAADVAMLLGLGLLVLPSLLHRVAGGLAATALAVSGLSVSVFGTAVRFVEHREHTGSRPSSG